MTDTVVFRIDSEALKGLRAKADKTKSTVSELARTAIADLLDEDASTVHDAVVRQREAEEIRSALRTVAGKLDSIERKLTERQTDQLFGMKRN